VTLSFVCVYVHACVMYAASTGLEYHFNMIKKFRTVCVHVCVWRHTFLRNTLKSVVSNAHFEIRRLRVSFIILTAGDTHDV